MLIPFTGPFDLTTTLESGQAFRWRREGEWLTGVVFDNIIRTRRTPEGVEFECAPDDETAIAPLFRDYLRMDDDLEAICESIRVDDRIGAALCRYPGLRVLRQEPWECLISFICSANNNVKRISVNVEDIADSFGRPLALGEYRRRSFPSPARLAEAGEARLRALGLGFRAKYVAQAARIVAGGELDPFTLREADYDEALAALTALPGVGDKVANCVLLMSLDKRKAFPVDVWIDRALREWYPEHMVRANGKPLTRAAMRPWAQAYFGEFAGYANQYLFQGRRLLGKRGNQA